MDERPKLENSPGHTLRPRAKGQWAVFWQAPSVLVRRGYGLKSVRIAIIGPNPTDTERAEISDRCRDLQLQMKEWKVGGIMPLATFDGTLGGLIRCYQTDPDSPFQKLRFESRSGYRRFLGRIDADHGDTRISEIRGRQAKHWHDEWTRESGVAMAHGLVGMLRTVIAFGATILDSKEVNEECLRVETILSKMRFTMAKPRVSVLTVEHVNAIRAKAHERGFHSIALAQVIQFECMLRQRDVIGEWVPQSEPGISYVLFRGSKWMRGLRWEEIDANRILRHVTSKRQKEVVIDLKLAPMVVEELARTTIMPTGPVIVCEETGRPYTNSAFRRYWRQIARAAGVPDDVRNMDSRAGAISEATDAGAPLELVRHAATHSDISMTQRYSRGGTEKTAEVMQRRIEHRNKPKP